MPSIKRKLCSKHGIYEGKKCEECKKQTAKIYNEQSRNKESTAVYNTRKWQKLREQQLIKEPLCINFSICGNVAKIADHIIEISQGGKPFDIDNLRSVCQSCHNTITAENRRNRNLYGQQIT